MRVLPYVLSLVVVANVVDAQSGTLFIEDMTWVEVRDAIQSGKTTALYMAGSTEEGGPHMVLGKHNILARQVAMRIAEELGNALVYPTMPFAPTGDPAKKDDLMEFPGSISVSDETFGRVAREVAESAIAAGFKNVVLMGEHGGGIRALKRVSESLDARWGPRGIHVYFADGDPEYQRQVDAYLKSKGLVAGEHAGIPDTSKLLFVDESGQWVRKDRLAPGGRWSETGVDGDPTKASADIGRVLMGIEVEVLTNKIRALVARRAVSR